MLQACEPGVPIQRCIVLAWTDRNGPRLGRPALGHPDGQDAVLGVRLGGIKVDITGDHDLSEERAEPPLPDLELCFGQLADFLHASEDQQVAVDGELDFVGSTPGISATTIVSSGVS